MHTVHSRRLVLVLVSLSLVLGPLAFNPGAQSAAPNESSLSRTNEQVTLLYIDALNFYKEGKYEQASGAIAKIQAMLAGDAYTNNVRKSLQIQPTDSMLADLSARFQARQIEYTEAKRLYAAGEYARAKTLFDGLVKESPQSADIAKYANSIAQREAKAQSQAQRQQAASDEKARKEAALQAQAEEKASQKAQALLERESQAQELARQKEEARQAQELRDQERQAQRQARLKEIEDRQEAERAAHAKQLEEAASRKEELRLAKERQMQERENARLALIQQKQEQEQEQLEAKKSREEEARLKKEMEDARLADLKTEQDAALAQKRQELAVRQEELNRRKQELRLQQERQKQDEETARQARAQELARQKEEQRLQQERLAQEREAVRLAKLQELAKQKEAQQKLAEEKKAQQQAELKAREELAAKQKAEYLAKLEFEKQQRQAALEKQAQAAELARKQKLEQLTRQREQEQVQLAARQAALQAKAQEQARRQQELRDQMTLKKQQQLDEIARRKQETPQPAPAPQPAPTLKVTPVQPTRARERADIQEKMLGDAKTKKQMEDQAKIAKADHLWDEARRHYRQGAYDQAVAEFQEIIQIEGNPRIKYTPYAKEYIEKAKEKIDAQKSAELSQQIDKTDDKMIEQVQKTQIPPYIEPPEVTQKSTEMLIEPPPIRKLLKKKVSLDFDKVDLKTVVNFLSEESGVNMIVSQKVLDLQPKVSARFTDVQVDEAIKYVIKSLGLIYRIDKDMVWIAHPEEIAQEPLETRVYYLNKGGGLFTEFSPLASSSETGLGGSSAQINKVMTIEDTLKDVVTWPADAKLTYDKRLNALIVRNTPQNLQMLEDILYSLDVTPVQILIEARFLEVDVTDTKELGLTWDVNNGAIQEKGGQLSHGFTNNSGVDFTTFTNSGQGLNLTYQGLLTTPQFQTVLHAMQTNQKIKTLSSPRITTLNNQAATIKVVDEWIYPTRYEYEIIQVDLNGDGRFDGPGETTYKNVPKDFLRRDVGILLKVVPAVGADRKTISLSLIPEVSEATPDAFVYTGDVKLPKFTSRNLSTTVVVDSGETVVLGGLIKENRTKTLTKVPILGDVPMIGSFFRKNADTVERKNLIIFVTAKVISPAGDEIVIADKK